MRLIKFLILYCLIGSGGAQALVVNGPTPTVSTTQDYEIPLGAPADVYLWEDDYPGTTPGYDAGFGSYICSYSDIRQTCSSQSTGSTITMILKEKRNGMEHPLQLQAYLQNIYYDESDPSKSVMCGHPFSLTTYNRVNGCRGKDSSTINNTKMMTVWIPQSEMNNLPIGGVWKGQLKIGWSQGGGGSFTYTANITLKGKAAGKQDIYFPEFNGANPLVQLDLHPTGSVTGNSYVEDITTLDMCLYDGYNSNSDSMTLSFKDEGKAAAGRKTNYFSIYNTASGGTDNTERIDYRVEMFDPHSKGWITVKNNDSFTLSAGINGTDKIRPVRLPSIPYPVLCAPTPLRLIVDKFRVTDKSAGYYRGTLTVEFSPSLNSI
ncbi:MULTISPECIES: CfaE/CblD family pilus tip adhesin [Klebsiella]|uniref:CfaE/CblD family pilus tip adhesin n=1 Tax=Klebsiella TaxID=570 RepID=UPI0009833FF6|nr:CfaE/CblD family pilus tip adhesin [Klebsiella michiganensis]ELN3894631.1 pilin protein [Klebsiella michiganensis]ELS5412236.1 pilin protein [Klebsiella michiganensis]MCW9619397.1 CfaE/CblD family pilus tip adhesin [Klebsiella michiganensis]MDU3690266.1 CfaE/CblD family pilus tip adhesin [Klebsiella michiganensis]MDU3716114.1 CfaE/CblD family pilus tip adhesin [Klebsiella michiganensis]